MTDAKRVADASQDPSSRNIDARWTTTGARLSQGRRPFDLAREWPSPVGPRRRRASSSTSWTPTCSPATSSRPRPSWAVSSRCRAPSSARRSARSRRAASSTCARASGCPSARVDPSTASESLRLVVRGSTRPHLRPRPRGSPNPRDRAGHGSPRDRATDEDVEELARIHADQAGRLPRHPASAPAWTCSSTDARRADPQRALRDHARLAERRDAPGAPPGDADAGRPRDGVVEHGAILDAIGARDPAAARRAMSEHLTSAAPHVPRPRPPPPRRARARGAATTGRRGQRRGRRPRPPVARARRRCYRAARSSDPRSRACGRRRRLVTAPLKNQRPRKRMRTPSSKRAWRSRSPRAWSAMRIPVADGPGPLDGHRVEHDDARGSPGGATGGRGAS